MPSIQWFILALRVTQPVRESTSVPSPRADSHERP